MVWSVAIPSLALGLMYAELRSDQQVERRPTKLYWLDLFACAAVVYWYGVALVLWGLS